MEQSPNVSGSGKEKKIYKAGVVDVSVLAESQARDVADHRMTESKEDRGKNWFTRTTKRMWKHNLAQEWYRQREIGRARQEISDSGNLYAGEIANAQSYDEAKQAIIARFTSEYEEEMLKEEEKESKKTLDDPQTQTAIKELIRQFAADPSMSEEAFTEEQNRVLAFSNPAYAEKGKMYASNLLDIAKEVRNSVAHGEKLAEMDFDVEIILGQAQETLNTEAKKNTFEKMQNSAVGKYLLNEPVAVSIAAGLYSAGNFAGMKILRSKAAQIGTFGATAIMAGGISAGKEAARLNRERAQHMRERAKGMKFTGSDMERRQQMEENRYETKDAKSIIQALEKDLAKISTGNIDEAGLDAVLVNLSDLETRVQLGDKSKLDLVAYSSLAEVEKERMTLDLSRAKLKVAIRKGIADGRIAFTKGTDFNAYLQKLVDTQSGDLSTDVEKKDAIFKSMKRKKVAGAFLKTAFIGAAAGVVFQEAHAAFQSDHDGIVEGAIKHFGHNQDKLASHTTALEGLRRHMMGEDGTLPFGKGHEMVLGNTHIQLPEGVSMNANPDGTYNLMHGNDVVSNHVKLDFTAKGDLTDASKELLSKNGVLTAFAQTGAKATEHVTSSAQEYVNKHPELTTKIHRGVWMENNTPMYPDPNHPGHMLGADLNELRTHWGGEHGTGIDAKGNYVLNVQSMKDDGSFEKGLSVAAHDQMKKKGLSLLLSVTRGTQHTVFKVPIDENGNAIIDAKSAIGKMMFQNTNGHAVLIGAFAEIGHSTGMAEDGGENMQILSTVIGSGRPGEVAEDLLHDTTVQNVKFNVPADWDYEVPPFIPIPLARRPLEKEEKRKQNRDIPTMEYMYGGFSEINRKDYENRMSESIKNNPDAELDEKKEIKEYLARQNEEHLKNLTELVAQASPMKKDCKLSVCIPVAGHQEEKNIYKTLENYLNQSADKNNFEIVLLVNNPDKDKEGNIVTPDGTMAEIKRFMQDHPEINVAVMNKVIPLERVTIGYVRKLLNDAVLQRNISRGDDAPSHIMLSNDADNKGVSPEYIKNFIDKFEQNPDTDSYMGQLDWDPESYVRNPLIHIGTRLFQYVDLQLRNKNIPSSGANFAFRSSVYAAINGYSENTEIAEDVELGRAIKASRIGGKEKRAIDFAGARVSRLFTSSRRAEKAIKDGLSPVEQWSKGFGAFDDEVRKVDWENMSEKIDYTNKEEVKKLVGALEQVINRTIKAMTWAQDDLILFKRSLGWLGIKYEITENNQIKITDASKLIAGLEKYQTEGLQILKRKTEKTRGSTKNEQTQKPAVQKTKIEKAVALTPRKKTEELNPAAQTEKSNAMEKLRIQLKAAEKKRDEKEIFKIEKEIRKLERREARRNGKGDKQTKSKTKEKPSTRVQVPKSQRVRA